MKLVPLEIVTPHGVVFFGEVKSVTLPGKEGEFGVLAGHASLVTPLKEGFIKVEHEDGSVDIVAIDEGVCKVDENRVSVLILKAIYIQGNGEIGKSLEKARKLLKKISVNKFITATALAKMEV